MLPLVLKIVAPVFLLVGGLHLVLGLEADVLLGANLSADVLSDPVLDSQNRFYGVAFSAYGLVLYICAGDLIKYQSVLRVMLWVFFAAGCARLVSIMLYGMPSQFVLLLLATEIIFPPVVAAWLSRVLNVEQAARDSPEV